ncbi:bacillithiol biosynthesis cysteine-adding enzyme BshC [Pullulanibacillus pueri]|nr:bacillithiol biosynthesis cysteine-adding enzyme BshC [Pullulanibacillus pueri]
MRIEKLNLPETSNLTADYISDNGTIGRFFDYSTQDMACYQKRLEDLHKRSYNREGLVDYLMAFNQQYEASPKVINNIQKLKDERTVVVVGGQQAGLLTGPVYTIHKCLSILQLAHQQEKALGVPVVPVFWIAGEDHDYAEVNHVFAYHQETVRKLAYHQKGTGLDSLSRIDIDKQRLNVWIESVFQAYGETSRTKALLAQVKQDAEASKTFIDFFARQIHRLFGDSGLILMDSGDPKLRHLESGFFNQLIAENEKISGSVVTQLEALRASGYTVNLDQSLESANLFIHDQDERILLYRKDKQTFVNENKGYQVSRAELLDIAETHPERLSNNVVTRPLMQEFLLPTLAFIGGPGEIAYWSGLKEAFHVFDFKMPPVVLRHRLTMVDRKTEKWLKGKQLTVEDGLSESFYKEKEAWLGRQHQWDVEGVVKTVKKEMASAYTPLAALAAEVDSELETLTQKNQEIINNQIDYMKKTIERRIRQAHSTELRKFDRVKACLLPDGSPQERVWSTFYFLNYWGSEVIDELLQTSLEFDGKPYIVYL